MPYRLFLFILAIPFLFSILLHEFNDPLPLCLVFLFCTIELRPLVVFRGRFFLFSLFSLLIASLSFALFCFRLISPLQCVCFLSLSAPLSSLISISFASVENRPSLSCSRLNSDFFDFTLNFINSCRRFLCFVIVLLKKKPVRLSNSLFQLFLPLSSSAVNFLFLYAYTATVGSSSASHMLVVFRFLSFACALLYLFVEMFLKRISLRVFSLSNYMRLHRVKIVVCFVVLAFFLAFALGLPLSGITILLLTDIPFLSSNFYGIAFASSMFFGLAVVNTFLQSLLSIYSVQKLFFISYLFGSTVALSAAASVLFPGIDGAPSSLLATLSLPLSFHILFEMSTVVSLLLCLLYFLFQLPLKFSTP